MQTALMQHLILAALPTAVKVIFIVLTVIIIALVILYFFGRRMQKKQAATADTIENMKQTMSMLIIDKKKMKIKDSGLPAAAIEGTPKYLRWTKVPIVKAKVGPKVMILSAEPTVYEILPIKKECKVEISGLYITGLKSVRGGTVPKPEKRKGFRAWLNRFNKKLHGGEDQGQPTTRAAKRAAAQEAERNKSKKK